MVKGGVDGFLDRLFKQLVQGSARGQLLDLSFKLLNLLGKLLELFLLGGYFVVLRLVGSEGWRKVRLGLGLKLFGSSKGYVDDFTLFQKEINP